MVRALDPARSMGACEGEGSTRRCLAGMPVGVTSSVGDISNTGAQLFRIVHAQLLGEAAL
jgi:hypothetical protein